MAMIAIHPVLMSRTLSESIRFFDSLGFDLAFVDDPAEPRYAALRRDAVELHLQWADAGQWREGVDRPAYRILVEDVDALFRELVARGVPPAEGSPWGHPGDTPWGTREFHLADPDGNQLHFYAAAAGAGRTPAG
jgi:catechol 2,3-dioxygenase-like lactoylglutathione lyase family enzyme